MSRKKAVTISDVAKHLNISKSTISQYLNGRYEYMAEDTRKKIEQAIEEMEYSPNSLAQSLKNKKTSTIGVIVANILHSFSTQIIRAIEDICFNEKVHVIICNADDDPQKEEDYIRMLMAKQVDGFIIFPTGSNPSVYSKMIANQIPTIFLDRIIPDFKINTLLLDNYKASELAVEAFDQKGHKNIAMITMEAEHHVTPRIERIAGFCHALEKRNLEVKEEYILSDYLHNMQNRLKELFDKKTAPSAIFAGNDLTLLEVLTYCKKNNLRIPEDISIISVDDVSFADIYEPALTTISQPAHDIGAKAASLLLDQIQGKEPLSIIHRFAPSLIERSSVSQR